MTYNRQEEDGDEVLDLLGQRSSDLVRDNEADEEGAKDGVDADLVRDEGAGEDDEEDGARHRLRRAALRVRVGLVSEPHEHGSDEEPEREDPADC